MSINNSQRLIRKVCVLIGIALAIGLMVGCSAKAEDSKKSGDTERTITTTEPSKKVDYEIGKTNDVGNGSIEFTIKIVNQNDKITTFNVKTDKDTVGEALQELGIIDGEEGPYGLYVQEACGEKHIYEETGSYWSLYIDNKPATTGVDTTKIDKDKEYKLVVEAD